MNPSFYDLEDTSSASINAYLSKYETKFFYKPTFKISLGDFFFPTEGKQLTLYQLEIYVLRSRLFQLILPLVVSRIYVTLNLRKRFIRGYLWAPLEGIVL
jgi:hypothetical protein